ncbi:hypothetical protein EG329_011352 [Mollisiaceae sp. DMI_Dod_QoI]|nr:hypothetical protein EG329_011352 [Helotiales sp. DMI_Dod_QoI]
MTEAAADSRTFPLFSTLAPELRGQIWRDALPGKIGPALYFYKRGCWCPRRLLESDEGYDPENDEHNLNFEFRPDLLDNVQFDVPLLFVSREARRTALAWVHGQGIEMLPNEGRQYPGFVRPFDLMRDTLYIALDKWDDFLCEPNDRLFQPDLLQRNVDIKPNLTRIAVPEALLRIQDAALPEIFWYFFHLKELFIVVDPQPDLESADNDMKVQRRWEIESTPGGAFFWNDDRGGFDFRDSGYIGDKNLYTLIEEANKELAKGISRHHIRGLEVRPVFAVRR